MRDEIFWGNLLGLLKKGKWTLTLEESEALIAVYLEADKRSRPPKFDVVKEPVKVDSVTKPKKARVKDASI